MKPRILNVESNNYSKEAVDLLNMYARVDYMDLTEKELLSYLKVHNDYEFLIVRLRNYIGEEVIHKVPNLRVIATATTGLNHLDIDECERRNIAIVSLKGEVNFLRSIHATAEHTWALLLSLIRMIPVAHFDVLNGNWNRDRFIGNELYGKTIGVIGFGRIGVKVAKYAKAFGMRVIANTKDVWDESLDDIRLVTLHELLNRSDVISIHVPLNNETKFLISRREINQMKRRPYLINTSRGQIIEENAILYGLKNGMLKGVAIDVIESEYRCSKISGNLLIEYAKTKPNLIITPHIGGATFESMGKTEVYLAKKLVKILKRMTSEKPKRI